MSLHLGITGGMGGGKSTLAKALLTLNVPVFFADEEARKLYQEPPFLAKVQAIMPGSVLLPEGGLDKQQLAHYLFKDAVLKRALEQLVHPAVAQKYADWTIENARAPILAREAAILFESGAFVQCDRIVVVTAPEAERIQRVKKRSGLSESDIRARMSHQWPDAEKMSRADVSFYHLRLQDYLPAAQWLVSWLHAHHDAHQK
jgi:dephospho-CoA kinase